MDNQISEHFYSFLDKTKYVLYITCTAYFLILLFIISPFKFTGFFDYIIKFIIIALLSFALLRNYNSLKHLYKIPGIFNNPNLSKIKTYFILNIFYTLLIGLLAIYVLYIIFF